MTRRSDAIGVFDSGVGGLSVVRALIRQLPRARVLYLADQAHVPYGGRPLEEVRHFAESISAFLVNEGCRAIVMACNISSATAYDAVARTHSPLPVYGMIAGAAAACAGGEDDRIAVLATEGTVRSGAYGRQIRRLRPDATVVEIACPRLVPFVEAGRLCGGDVAEAAGEYLAQAGEARCTMVILGCTHYPFLLPVLREAGGTHAPTVARFVDPAETVAREVAATPDIADAASPNEPSLLLTTGDPREFALQAAAFLPGVAARFGRAVWCAGDSGQHLVFDGPGEDELRPNTP